MENVYEPGEWDDYGEIPPGWCTKPRRLVRTPGRGMSASVYVVDPGETHLPYHFHHGAEEVLLVLEGAPTLRTPDGERVLAPGDVVHFPRGPEGARQLRNLGDGPTRIVVVAAGTSPEVVEYPDSGKLAAVAHTGPLWSMHFRQDATDYWDGEAGVDPSA
jgi:uncharacterized cupin superfamily protein